MAETNEPANTPTESTSKTKTRQQNPTSQQADQNIAKPPHPEINEPANTPTESTSEAKARQQNPTSQQADHNIAEPPGQQP